MGGGAVSESRYKTALPRDHGSEVSVEGVSVPEGRFETGLTRDTATGMPVAGVAVSG